MLIVTFMTQAIGQSSYLTYLVSHLLGLTPLPDCKFLKERSGFLNLHRQSA